MWHHITVNWYSVTTGVDEFTSFSMFLRLWEGLMRNGDQLQPNKRLGSVGRCVWRKWKPRRCKLDQGCKRYAADDIHDVTLQQKMLHPQVFVIRTLEVQVGRLAKWWP